ncbi:MAG: cysteine desulfurase-like protein [Saprospiraceae bacterium]
MNEIIRQQFPALYRQHNGKPLIFLDGPAGTQVPQMVIDAISDYYKNSNANTHGQFLTTQETDAIMDATRENLAAFLGAEDAHCISLGQNMTTLNFSLSRAIGRMLQPGDEILITQLDHEANRGPWLTLREQGIVVKEVRLLPTGALDYEDMERKLSDRTRLLAIGYSSNILGTVNDVHLARKLTYQVGAWLLLDAVHYTPHLPIDVQAIGCDFLLCSAYKFYGPHIGILYSRPGLLDRLPTDRLRTTYQHAPYSIETGTFNHAAAAGTNAAVNFIASLGNGTLQRERLLNAMQQISQHEKNLFIRLYNGLSKIKGVQVLGLPADTALRAPTLSFTVQGKNPTAICQYLAAHNVCAWDGHFYAIRATEILGVLEQGGVTRMGISVYTTAEEVDYTIDLIEKLTSY